MGGIQPVAILEKDGRSMASFSASFSFAAVAALLGAALVVCLVDGPPWERQPNAFDRVEHDFGPTKPGRPLQTSFVLSNHSGDALRIDKIVPSCGCMTHAVSQGPIAPGESRKILVEIETSRFVAPTDISKTVAITTSQPERPEAVTTVLKVKAQFREALAPESPSITLAAAEVGAPYQGKLRIAREGLPRAAFAMLRISDVPPGIQCRIAQRSSDALVLDCSTTDPDALLGEPVVGLAYTWADAACVREIPCRVERRSDVEATPACLILTQKQKPVTKGEIQEEIAAGAPQIRLASQGGEAVEIVDVSFPSEQTAESFVCSLDDASADALHVRFVGRLSESLTATELVVSYRQGAPAGPVHRLLVPVYVVGTDADDRSNRENPATLVEQNISLP